MKRLLILGGGTAGTMVANRLVHALDMDEWKITVVDQDEIHYYQPGFLFIPFGTYGMADVKRPKRDYLPREVEVIISAIELIDPSQKKVTLAKNKQVLSYDYLIIATGSPYRSVTTIITPSMSAKVSWMRCTHSAGSNLLRSEPLASDVSSTVVPTGLCVCSQSSMERRGKRHWLPTFMAGMRPSSAMR